MPKMQQNPPLIYYHRANVLEDKSAIHIKQRSRTVLVFMLGKVGGIRQGKQTVIDGERDCKVYSCS